MTTDLALEYIPRRMRELGYGDNYSIRFIHLVLQGNEVRVIEATTEFFILVEEPVNITVDSDIGVFDLAYIYVINELQYEHQGIITVTNNTKDMSNVRFIQVIPKTLQPKHGDNKHE